ncbi:MFS transporter [Cupriavidus sp. SK-3]|uniref:MFS transporter n=1 Tax=Cupriavidus sp. SK-3 TaxID=1470558 RepID=UPI0004475F24|nr:MFS transporter [Cupriavidus sp. SK-3]KDP89476.1 hypothetical protein CF70_031240 [Cupriavidus sp. SK-3]
MDISADRADGTQPGKGISAVHNEQGGKRAVWAATAGHVMEWYDFAVYGFMATLLAKTFFPAGDTVTSMLATFAVFGVGFVMRPVGGIVMGRIADVRGRKTALLVTMMLMAASTAMIGLTPSYASIGIAAPLLVVLARLIQGFSAGGEWGGATAMIVEWAPKGKRGLYGSFQQSSLAIGMLLGSAVCALCSSVLTIDTLESWGWRIPFLLGSLLGPFGLYLRRNLEDAPVYRKAIAKPTRLSKPEGFALAFRAFGFAIVWNVVYYMMLAFLPNFMQTYAGVPRADALWSNTIGLMVLVLAVPFMGYLSDKIGRKPLLVAACMSYIIMPYFLWKYLMSGVGFGAVVLVQTVFAIAISFFSGPGPATIAEMFPTESRSTWMSLGYSAAAVLFGGFSPFISQYLIGKTGSPLSPTLFLGCASVISLVFILRMRETAHRELD